jgi:hypothetical protein
MLTPQRTPLGFAYPPMRCTCDLARSDSLCPACTAWNEAHGLHQAPPPRSPYAKMYHQRTAAGVCPRCGGARDYPGRRHCRACRVRRSTARREG